MRQTFCSICALLLSSCSIYEAVHAPEPVHYKSLQIGESRADMVSQIGFPKMSEDNGQKTIDHYQFTDGYHPASKARVVLYAAGDVFTAGLAEVIFWPVELAILNGTECHGTVTYGPDNRVAAFNIVKNDGSPLWTGMKKEDTGAPPGPVGSATPAAAAGQDVAQTIYPEARSAPVSTSPEISGAAP